MRTIFERRTWALESKVKPRPACDLWGRLERYERYFAGDPVELSAEEKTRLAEHDRYFDDLEAGAEK